MKRFMSCATAAMFVCVAAVTFVMAADKAKVGDAAPDFSLQDQDGKSVSLADYKGKIVVLEWFNEDCPYVQRHHEKEQTMEKLSAKYADKDVVWLAVNSTSGKTNETNKAIRDKWSIKYPILNDSDGIVGMAYGAKSTPHMFIIGKDGKLAYAGGIDNDPDGNKGDARVNYVDKALTELTAGSTVSVASSQQYGCSVKYGKKKNA